VSGLALLVWGGGGHGKVVADVARAAGHAIAGYVDRDSAKLGGVVEPGGSVVVMTEDELRAVLAAGGALPHGAGAVALAIGDNALRAAALEALGGLAAPALVHPSAAVSPSAGLGAGTVVFPLAAVNAAATLGRGVIVNTGAIVEHDCVIGEGAHLSPGSVLGGGVAIGARSWVGAGATVLPGVRIGRGVRVGAGAVVLRDVPDGQTVAGVPARPLPPR
jgi:sugar O-acyltransferase (sialic acid O-acetyltransferase NeuD family)